MQQSLSSSGLDYLRLKVRQWISFLDWHPTYYDRNHESYHSAVENLKSTAWRGSENFLSQDDDVVTAMKTTPSGETMCRVHIADRSDKAPATKGIDAWKY